MIINKDNVILNMVIKKKIEDISRNKMPFTVYGEPEIINSTPEMFSNIYKSFRITTGKYILLNKTISIPSNGEFTVIFWVRFYANSNEWSYVYGPQSSNFPIIGIGCRHNYTGIVYGNGDDYSSSTYINGDNIWHQLCITKDSSGNVKYFVDGNNIVSISGKNYEHSIDMNIGRNVYRQGYYDCANIFISSECLYTSNFIPETFGLVKPNTIFLESNIKIKE